MSEFYILSLKWSRNNEGNLTWWRPNARGYTWSLDDAGRYLEADAKRHDDHETAVAIPCEVAERLCRRVVPREAARAMLTEVLGRNAGLRGSTCDDVDYADRHECPQCERGYGHPGPSKLVLDDTEPAEQSPAAVLVENRIT